MKFELIEPLRYLFKDEVRRVGEALGLPEEMVWRQPFPGPGLAVRIIGDVTAERLDMLRGADAIVIEEVQRAGLYGDIWQSFAVLPTDADRGRAWATTAPTASGRAARGHLRGRDDRRLGPSSLRSAGAGSRNRIVNEVPGVNRVVYDITSKPPGTIEWE